MTKPIKIDFVSDISCPWCVIGLHGLEQALDRVGDLVVADIHFQPFELNPDMPAEGQSLSDHIAEKFGASAEQSATNREAIRGRAGALGFDMRMGDDHHIYNTFDAHRLLHWAGLNGKQAALKHALFETYFTDGQSPGDHAVLIEAAGKAGLDREEAGDVLESGLYADEVRAAEQLWRSRGINSVPAIVINDRYIISGGQPPEAFEGALRQIAAEA